LYVANFPSEATCKANDGIPANAVVNDIDTSACTQGTYLGATVYFKFFCDGGNLIRTGYAGAGCTGFAANVTEASSYSCQTASGGFYASRFCAAGAFKPPTPGVTQTSFSDDKCAVATNTYGKSTSGTWYPLNTCVDSGSGSGKATCSGGKPVTTIYTANKCSGTGTSTTMSTDCTKDGSVSYKWSTCTSSGAASTSITILSLALLVLATFSSTM
jgi:hypothetical protein